MIFYFLLLFAPLNGEIQAPSRSCRTPPESGFLTAQQMDFICDHRSHWIKESSEGNGFKDVTTVKQQLYLKAVERCTRTNCIDTERRRKKREIGGKTIRKEIRMFAKEERDDLFKAMNILKRTMIDNITAWDLHTLVHYPDSAPGAHWGPAFLPWHREFLRQFEIALQREIPTVSLPYWDSTLDQGLPDPADSVLFTDEIVGNGNGYVKTGPFKDWDTNVLMPLSQIPVKKLYRSTGGRAQDRLMNPTDVEWITSRKNFSQLTFCHDKTFESIHGLSHVWVGGFMYVITVSPNDPMFYMHHAFIDHLWEQFRQKMQNRGERESQWAKETCNDLHAYDAQMKPFRIQNRDGLSNQYTDEWYEYEPIHHCTPEYPQCEGSYLWCDVATWRCRGKVVLGGNCTGYEGQPICYNSICQKSKCTVPPRILSSMKQRKNVERRATDVVWAKTMLVDYEGRGLNSDLAEIRITDSNGDNITVYSEGQTEYPEIPGTIYLSLPKPRAGLIQNITMEARDANGRYCQAQCYNETIERYQVCQPELSIGYRAETSSSISYTHSYTSRKYLDVDLSVHPRDIKIATPYMVFVCSRKMVTSAMITEKAKELQPPVDKTEFVWFRVAVHRKSEQNLEIEVVPDVGDLWSSSLRMAASPFDPNIIFVQAPNPMIHPEGVRVRVRILEDGERIKCTVKCTKSDGSVRECDGHVDLHSQAWRSQEEVFSSNQDELQFLGWNMRGHPSLWRHRVPYLSLFC